VTHWRVSQSLDLGFDISIKHPKEPCGADRVAGLYIERVKGQETSMIRSTVWEMCCWYQKFCCKNAYILNISQQAPLGQGEMRACSCTDHEQWTALYNYGVTCMVCLVCEKQKDKHGLFGSVTAVLKASKEPRACDRRPGLRAVEDLRHAPLHSSRGSPAAPPESRGDPGDNSASSAKPFWNLDILMLTMEERLC
jgi:hypothetical protein